MICNPQSLIIRELFERHGYEHKIAAKNYLLHEAQQDWQLRFLHKAGLKPHHDFLDIGCGWLRLGAALLPYLEAGRYHGLDNTQTNLEIGLEFLTRLGIRERPVLLCDTDFSFERFGKRFDFAFCHAVFTHLSHAQIEACFANLRHVMKAGSRGFFTFYLSREDHERPNNYAMADGGTLEYASAYLSPAFLDALFRRLGLTWQLLPEQGHPTGHRVVGVRFAGPPPNGTPARSGQASMGADEPAGSAPPASPEQGSAAPSLYRHCFDGAGMDRLWDLAALRARLHEVGYAVVRRFCSEADTVDLREFWHRHPMASGRKGYWHGRPDYALHVPPGRGDATGGGVWSNDLRYECFFWNHPPHRTTYEIGWAANALRNAVWGLPIHTHLVPLDGYATSYRITRSDRGSGGVPSHADARLPGQPCLIQNSLLLSASGTDYGGGGMRLTLKDGRRINVIDAEAMQPGDLLIWDQQCEHEVPPVTQSDPDDPRSGSWRMLMPTHPVVARPELWKAGMTHLPPASVPTTAGGAR